MWARKGVCVFERERDKERERERNGDEQTKREGAGYLAVGTS